ncbi:PKD domain-containing protein [Candidatus Bipolaricaulota bacterium]|nr:PKD domain-containing protein [Candidatus Bipolaricaulota bacterium]
MRNLWRLLFLGFTVLFLGGCIPWSSGLRAVILTTPNPPRGPYPLTVRFEGGSSQGEVEEWVWTFFRLVDGEEVPLGMAISGKEVEYTFQERGKYRVYLTARTKDERFAQTFVDVDVRSKPPEAHFSATPYPEVQQGSRVSFDASLSHDPDGRIVRYLWDFGDGTWMETEDPKVSHTYHDPGTYEVKLVVIDDYGDSSKPFSLPKPITVVKKGCPSCG